ncbi:MAG: hypothetical protein WKF61_06210 [Luteimonas sp.]
MIEVTLPLHLVSGANVREHWALRSKRAKSHREACIAVPGHPVPCVVTLTRLGPRELDSDNLAISAKHVRDGIADRLGVNDNDKRVEWRYAQERSKEYGVRIVIQGAG